MLCLLCPDTDTSPGEREDIELLERALEKALWVRTGIGPLKKDADRSKQSVPGKKPATTVTTSKAALKGNQTTTRSTFKSASLDRKEHRRPGTSVFSTVGSRPSASYSPGKCKTTVNTNLIQSRSASSSGVVHRQAARKSQQTVLASGSLDHGHLHISTLHSKNKTVRGNVLSGEVLGRMPPSYNMVPVSPTNDTGAHRLRQQNGYVLYNWSMKKITMFCQPQLEWVNILFSVLL